MLGDVQIWNEFDYGYNQAAWLDQALSDVHAAFGVNTGGNPNGAFNSVLASSNVQTAQAWVSKNATWLLVGGVVGLLLFKKH